MSRARISAAFFAAVTLSAIFTPTTAIADDVCTATGGVLGLGAALDDVESSVALLDGLCEDQREPDPDPGPSPDPTGTRTTTGGAATARPEPVRTQDAPRAQGAPAPTRATDTPSRAAPEPPGGDERGDVPVASSGVLVPAGVSAAFLAGLVLAFVAGRRRARGQAIRGADAAMTAVLSVLPEGVVVADREQRVRMINEQAARLLGVDRAASVGRPLAGLLAGTASNGAWLPTWLRELSPAGGTATGTIEATSAPVGLSAATIAGGGPWSGSVLVIRDVASETVLERMKSEFLANVGHELRTPLTSALGFARLLRQRDLTPPQQDAFVGAIIQACEKLDRVVDLLVGVATLEGGRLRADADQVDVGEVVRQTIARWEHRSHGHVLGADVALRLPRTTANAALLRAALDELVDNAIKFSPGGGIVTVAAAARGETVELSVSDQGIGIEPDAIEEMFEDFRQADGSATRAFEGLGLGLGFVRRVAELHGGVVRATSEPGSGSTFTMAIPVRTPTTTAGAGAGARAERVRARGVARAGR